MDRRDAGAGVTRRGEPRIGGPLSRPTLSHKERTRAAVISAAETVLNRATLRCEESHRLMARDIATLAGFPAAGVELPRADALPLPMSSVFVRQDDFVPPDVAARFDAVLVCGRIEARHRRGKLLLANRDADYYAEVRATGTEVVLWDWMVPPNLWEKRLDELFAYAVKVGARGILFNVEPGSGEDKNDPIRDWRGKGAELRRFMAKARALCDAEGLELWVTSWANPPGSFGLAELVKHADVCIPQPYEVHGRVGPEYIAEVLDRWRGAGAKRFILGRGAHELDDSDDDSWRTAEQIAAHRKSTPGGMPEAWWTPRGSLAKRADLVDSMVASSR